MVALFFARHRPAVPTQTLPGGTPGPGSYLGETPTQLLKRIEFRILRRLDGFLFGDYSGLFYGPSLDLAEVREYQPGDEVRRIDWNVTARSGTLHVRQYREEREVRAWLVVDLSSSMAFGTRRVRKEELAFEFAGLTAAVVTRRGNKVGALSFSEGDISLSPLGGGRRAPLELIGTLLRTSASRERRPNGPRPTLASALAEANRILKRKALVFVVSDFIEPEGGERRWESELRRLALRHEVIAVKISDPAERELPLAGDLRLRDPETGRELWVDTADPRVRREHARLVAERQAALTQAFRRSRVDLLEISTSQGVVAPVVRFTLSRRGRRQ
ncbi:MAG TPA: DUF58 domain-containing protein [Trueperaceae bacterium]